MVIIICRNTPLFHTIYSPMQFLLQSRSNLPVGSLVQGYHINRQDKLLQSLRKPKGTRKQLPSVLYTRQEVMILDPMDNVWSQRDCNKCVWRTSLTMSESHQLVVNTNDLISISSPMAVPTSGQRSSHSPDLTCKAPLTSMNALDMNKDYEQEKWTNIWMETS